MLSEDAAFIQLVEDKCNDEHMRKLKLILLLALVSLGKIVSAQLPRPTMDYRIDTVNVEGYLITFTEILGGGYVVDRIGGSIFLMKNTYADLAGKRKYKSLKAIENLMEKQNAVFMNLSGVGFWYMNLYYFHEELSAWAPDKSFYPTLADYSFKHKDFHFKCTPVKVRCLRVTMGESELSLTIAVGRYSFDMDRIPVYIMQGIAD